MNIFQPVSLFLIVTTASAIYKTNRTDFSQCKMYHSQCRLLTFYTDFLQFSDQYFLNDSMLDFHFSVLAASDAHILLAQSEEVTENDPAYEILLGAGNNTYCEIRREQKSQGRAFRNISGLLDTLYLRSFWIHISKNGLIEVGREGEESAFIFWQDPDPLSVKVFSFATWNGMIAEWIYDCPRKNFQGNSTNISQTRIILVFLLLITLISFMIVTIGCVVMIICRRKPAKHQCLIPPKANIEQQYKNIDYVFVNNS